MEGETLGLILEDYWKAVSDQDQKLQLGNILQRLASKLDSLQSLIKALGNQLTQPKDSERNKALILLADVARGCKTRKIRFPEKSVLALARFCKDRLSDFP
jgi:hypothetical protein